MERIVSKVREEKITKVTESFEEINSHVFDNREGDHHVSGVYRRINKVYKNQVQNYGKRLMYEFMIPEPAQLHKLGLQDISKGTSGMIVKMPVDPRTIGFDDPAKITELNYLGIASQYDALVNPPFANTIQLDFAFSKDNVNPGKDDADLYRTTGLRGFAASLSSHPTDDHRGRRAESFLLRRSLR